MTDFLTPILKVTESCNYSCSYCRYAKCRRNSLMSTGLAKDIIKQCCSYNMRKNHKYLHIIFHGGEPLLWGKERFYEILQYERECMEENPDLEIFNSIQTNGSLIDDEWIHIFHQGDFDVGISIDGPEPVNFHKSDRVEDALSVLRNIRKLSASGCKYGVLSVITDYHTDAKAYYDFLVENDIHSVGLCFCYDTPENSVNNTTLSKFLTELFNLYFFGSYRLRIREFDNPIKKYISNNVISCQNSERKNCGNYFSITGNGDVVFCDSYSLSNSPIGNITNSTIQDIIDHESYQSICADAKNFYSQRCLSCNVKVMCGGGCYRNDHRRDPSQIMNYFCSTYQQLYIHIQKIVDEARATKESVP